MCSSQIKSKILAFSIVDGNVFEPCKVACFSLLLHNPEIDITLIAYDNYQLYKDYFEEKFRIKVIQYQYDTFDNSIEEVFDKIPNIICNANILFFNRLKYIEDFKDEYDILIMFDVDILCVKKLQLDNFINSQNHIAGFSGDVCDKHIKFAENKYKSKGMVLNGFTMFNTKYIAPNTKKNILNIIKTDYNKLFRHDETVINKIFENKLLYEHEIANFIDEFNTDSFIFHFSGKYCKPWNFPNPKTNATLMKLYILYASKCTDVKFLKTLINNYKFYGKVDKLYFYFESIFNSAYNKIT